MDDKQITAGLALLADDMTGSNVDIDDVIATAKLRSQRRQAVTFTALGTTTMVVALAAVLTSAGIGQDTAPLDREVGSATKPHTNQSPPKQPVLDDQATKLTNQLAEAKASLIPAGIDIEPEPYTESYIAGGPVEPLKFVFLPEVSGSTYYAFAKLADTQGWTHISLEVSRMDPAKDWVLRMVTCPPAIGSCTERTLEDGTRAVVHVMTEPGGTIDHTMFALRPDGTFTVVSNNNRPNVVSEDVKPTRPGPQLAVEDMFKFATAFTW